MRRSRPFELAAHAGLVLAALFTAAAVAIAARWHQDLLGALLAVVAVALIALAIVGAAAVRAAPRNPVSWIFLSAGVAMPLGIAAYLYATAAYEHGADLPGARWAGWLDGWPWVPGLVAIATVGVLCFPDGRLPGARWRPVLWADLVVLAVLAVSVVFGTHLLDFPDRANPTALPGVLGDGAEGLLAVIVLVAPLSTLGAIALHRRRRRETDPARAGALALVAPAAWLVAASWWACLSINMLGGSSIDALPLESAGMLAVAVTSWIAIRRYGLFDARLVLRRSLVYGGLSLSVVVLYLLVVAALGAVVSGQLSRPVAVAVAVLVALPLRDLLQQRANRLVYGARDDPYGALVRLGERLADSAQPTEVLPAATRMVREALRVPCVAIRLRGEVVAEAGAPVPGGRSDELPLVFANETIGTLVVASRDEPLTAAERELLDGITHQVAAAAHAVSLTTDLLRSRERLVTATEEERRRLRRDLHDGLGPALAGIVLGLQLARRRLDGDADSVAERLDALTAQTQAAVAEVRRLVYGLRPPALDELGLLGALDEQARTLGPITVRGPARQLTLGAAVEAAAYRIALEAMTNVHRHARATACTVRVDVDSALQLEIEDDGVGLPASYRAGVGITSMRERATELGGTCTIDRRVPSGTRVRISIPLGET